ncbi:hypothetical protein COO60DRAFT_1479173 [Scenedesmus sp. NREL 46B-D3]|nr:hypothetical protein COO60DRAFT_1479173 [Scenedesmus sp. NREL 46B-D3]
MWWPLWGSSRTLLLPPCIHTVHSTCQHTIVSQPITYDHYSISRWPSHMVSSQQRIPQSATQHLIAHDADLPWMRHLNSAAAVYLARASVQQQPTVTYTNPLLSNATSCPMQPPNCELSQQEPNILIQIL